MRRKNVKDRCEKRTIPKCKEICKTYDDIQFAAADYLISLSDVAEIRCNVLMNGLLIEGKEYTSDFVCTKTNGYLMVRECVFAKNLSSLIMAKRLEASRKYWSDNGVSDWGLIVDDTE